jgi:hypothetical protein
MAKLTLELEPELRRRIELAATARDESPRERVSRALLRELAAEGGESQGDFPEEELTLPLAGAKPRGSSNPPKSGVEEVRSPKPWSRSAARYFLTTSCIFADVRFSDHFEEDWRYAADRREITLTGPEEYSTATKELWSSACVGESGQRFAHGGEHHRMKPDEAAFKRHIAASLVKRGGYLEVKTGNA